MPDGMSISCSAPSGRACPTRSSRRGTTPTSPRSSRSPGFRGARRYWLAQAAPNRPSIEFRHLGAYVLDGPPPSRSPSSAAACSAGEMTTARLVRGCPLRVVRRAAPLEDAEIDAARSRLHRPEPCAAQVHDRGVLRLVLRPRAREPHLGRVRRSVALRADARHRRSRVAEHRDPRGLLQSGTASFPSSARRSKRSFEAGRVDIPDWMPEGEFHSYDCLAAAALSRSPAFASSGH